MSSRCPVGELVCRRVAQIPSLNIFWGFDKGWLGFYSECMVSAQCLRVFHARRRVWRHEYLELDQKKIVHRWLILLITFTSVFIIVSNAPKITLLVWIRGSAVSGRSVFLIERERTGVVWERIHDELQTRHKHSMYVYSVTVKSVGDSQKKQYLLRLCPTQKDFAYSQSV